MSGPSRRARADGGRTHSVRVSFSDMEMAVVRTAAMRAGVADASWVGQTAVGAAGAVPGPATSWGPVLQDLMVLRTELMENRRVLTNVGGNLNDVARHANSTGEVHQATVRVQSLVARAVERVEEAVVAVEEMTAKARRERLRGRP